MLVLFVILEFIIELGCPKLKISELVVVTADVNLGVLIEESVGFPNRSKLPKVDGGDICFSGIWGGVVSKEKILFCG
jgi:hypothetical protein